jgi:hypothetical protein
MQQESTRFRAANGRTIGMEFHDDVPRIVLFSLKSLAQFAKGSQSRLIPAASI